MLKYILKVASAGAFFVFVTPIGVILRLFGVDYLDRKPDKNRKTYWIDSDRVGHDN
jgi:hypothetical protein